MVTKQDQIQFYTEELEELEFSVKKTFNSTGLSLFQNGELYIGQFKGIDEKRGNIFVDIPYGSKYHAPRLDQKLTCFTLKEGLEKPSSWSNLTYSDLLSERNRSETKIVDYIPSKREGWITMLIREMDTEFIEILKHNQILAFGPVIPPFEYLHNLLDFSKTIDEQDSSIWNKILSFKFNLDTKRIPTLITEDVDIVHSIIEDLDKSPIYVFQGPPGTGKTHQISDLVSRLIKDNNSVLITALTNKASVEVCEKPFLTELMKVGKINKLPLSIDERKKFPNLQSAKNLNPSKGFLTLTTFYQFSRIWEDCTGIYDYIIVEEASQAYLTTIAAASKVAKKVIVVGDPKQIIPIVTNKNYTKFPNIEELINGMNTVSQINDFVFKRKIETRRLTARSTEFTNSFYENTIQSKSLFKDLSEDISKLKDLARYAKQNGGPTLLLFTKEKNSYLDEMLSFLISGIDELSDLKNNQIAVLTPYIESLTYLQQNLKQKTKNSNYLVESVDRVQGLDVDYCFYVIPRASSFPFNLNRFNVATSRAKKCTFILAPEDFEMQVNLQGEVANYLTKLSSNFSFKIDSNNNINQQKTISHIENSNVLPINKLEEISDSQPSTLGVKIIGKIDVSKFEKPKKEIKKDKENIYIIDTNVFVDYPDIISKIDKQYKVVLSAKVIDELDYLKITLSEEQKRNVQRALKHINESIDARGIKMETADINLLPNDFNKKSPDNFILSVALKFQTENPIMLTSDNGLQIKAKGLGITTISLKDFLKQGR
jgi:DNA replication ATP-dependent helicase Dna2